MHKDKKRQKLIFLYFYCITLFTMMNLKDIIANINTSMDRWYTKNAANKICKNVCCVCDKIVVPFCILYIWKEELEFKHTLLMPRCVLQVDITEFYMYEGVGTSMLIRKCLLSLNTVVTVGSRNKRYKY